jgi:ABC-2 type transport system permease protein
MNLTVIRLTMRGLLGRRRAILLLILPVILLGLAGLTRWSSGGTPDASATLAGQFAMGTLLPLMCLLVSTGVIGAAFVFEVLPTIVVDEIAGDAGGRLSLAFGASTALAAIAHTALFVALSVATHNAVILGLLYALLWETVLGGYVPGIGAVSARQGALSVGEQTLGSHAATCGVSAEVGVTGAVMLVVATVAATCVAIGKLQPLRLTSAD